MCERHSRLPGVGIGVREVHHDLELPRALARLLVRDLDQPGHGAQRVTDRVDVERIAADGGVLQGPLDRAITVAVLPLLAGLLLVVGDLAS